MMSSPPGRAVENSPPAFVVIVDPTGIIKAVNDSPSPWYSRDNPCGALFEVGQNYLEGCARVDGEASSAAQSVARGLGELLQGGRAEFVFDYSASTAQRWFRLVATRLSGNLPGWAVVGHVDITDRRQVEEHARKVSMAVEQSPVSIVITDTAGTIEYVNPHMSQVSGFDVGEVVGKNPRMWKGPDTPLNVYRDLWATISSGRIWEGDLQNTRRDGEPFWEHAKIAPLRNDEGAITHYVAVKEDVTGRRRAEAELRASEGRLRALFETVNLIALGLDCEGNVEYVNPFFLKLTGYAHDEVIGLNWLARFIPPNRRADMAGVFQQMLVHGVPAHYTNPIVTRAGHQRTISWHNTVLHDEAGRVTGTLSLGEDITEHAQLEDQYRQAQKMEAVGRLAGGVAHDFNNHLTVISSYSEMLLADLGPADPRRVDLEEIRKAAAGAASLTRQLLAFSRQQVIEPRSVDLSDLVNSAGKMLKRLIGEDIELVVKTSPTPITVHIDPGQLEQVIMNLAVNSRDAMPEGGQLTIETAAVILDHEYAATHWPAVPGQFAMLALSDTGLGMDERTRERIFEPFFTTKESGKGTGLGLATVYGIVKQSRGFIWVYSEPGEGTTFKVYLPLSAAMPAHAVTHKEPSMQLRGNETVLLVEDSESVRVAARQILERLGYSIVEASSGAMALDTVHRDQTPVHLLLTDVIMPGMSGRELAERFQALRPGVKVLFMSGYTDDAVVLHGVLEAGLAYLQKPFSPDNLARKVREVLDAS